MQAARTGARVAGQPSPTTSNDSVTLRYRSSRAASKAEAPIVLVVGSDWGSESNWTSRVTGFSGKLVVGRKPSPQTPPASTLVLRDPTLSSRHMIISSTGDGEFEVRDLGSTNGTLVNGEEVKTSVTVGDGAVIFAGSQVMVLRNASASQAEAIAEESASPLGPVATVNPAFAVTCQKMRRLAPTREHVLLVGETGTGKELYARAIHHASPREGEFVAVDCAAVSPELLEAELFGASETGGLVARAKAGTLFLGEVDQMDPRTLAKLLRLSDQIPLAPSWGAASSDADVRIIAASSRPMPSGDSGAGRLDLAVRLGTEALWIPPLRDRVECIGALAHAILNGYKRSFEPEAFQALCLYAWPGNLRELSRTLAAAEALAQGCERIGLEHLPSSVSAPPPAPPVRNRRRPRPAPSAEEIEGLLRRHRGNVLRVSRELDRKPAVVYRWARRFGLQVKGFRPFHG